MPIDRAPFSLKEYQRRHALVREKMNARGIDVLIFSDPSNQAWLTGYDGWSFYVHQAVIMPLEGEPFWWGRLQDSEGALRTVYMDNNQVLPYAESYVQSASSHPMEDLAERLKGLGYERSTIGVEMENYYYSAKAHQVLVEELSDANFVDATLLANWSRLIKSDEEIDFIQKASRISEKISRLAIEEVEVGMRKNDLVSKIVAAGIEGVGEDWGDYPAIVPMLPSGDDASASHLTWNGKPFVAGEATFFELSGCYRRYHAPLCRTVFLGKPPEFMQDAAKALTDGLEAGLEIARAGNRACDIAHALEGALEKIGIDRKGARCGYPVGLSYPPDWGERTLSFRRNDETVLEPGMVFHFMPGLWMDGWGLETTETILIQEKGPAKAFCNVERKLFVKD